MATAKKTAPKAAAKTASTAIVKAKVTALANIDEEFSAEVATYAKRLGAPSGNRVQVTQSKTFKLASGQEVDELEAVIVDFVAANYYYGKTYDRGNITPPKCFSIGLEPAAMSPSPNSPDKQCETCTGCWADAYKSADNGKGKACKNYRLLAVLPLDADDTTPLQVLRVSATAIRFFDSYVSLVAQKHKRPVRGVITKITMSDEEYPSLRFALGDALGAKDPLLAIAGAARESARQLLMAEPSLTESANDAKPAARRAPAKKAAGARR